MAGSASSLFHTTLSAPPTRTSHSQTVMVNPGGGIIQRRILSGVNVASHTRRRGALNARVRTMVVSVGVETCRPLAVMVGSFQSATGRRSGERSAAAGTRLLLG